MDEKVADAPIRFYAIGIGDYEGYWETFVFATSPQDAVDRYVKNSKVSNDWIFGRKYKADVYAAEINSCGILESTMPALLSNVEVEC